MQDLENTQYFKVEVEPENGVKMILSEVYEALSDRSTEGCANRKKYVCPKCGKIHTFPDAAFCKNCQDMYYVSTVFGKVLKGLSVEYKGKK